MSNEMKNHKILKIKDFYYISSMFLQEIKRIRLLDVRKF